MPISNDCISTSKVGRNLTPVDFINSVHEVFPVIDIDLCSDNLANQAIKAKRILTFEDDAYAWKPDPFESFLTSFMNPFGESVTGGSLAERLEWKSKRIPSKGYTDGYEKPKHMKVVKASDMHQKAFGLWWQGTIHHHIGLCYRGGSVASLGKQILSRAIVCVTCMGVPNPELRGGRLSFDRVVDEKRCKETSNTQNSLVYLLSDDIDIQMAFYQEFCQWGQIFIPANELDEALTWAHLQALKSVGAFSRP